MGLEIKHTIMGRTLAIALETMACHTRWPVIIGNIGFNPYIYIYIYSYTP